MLGQEVSTLLTDTYLYYQPRHLPRYLFCGFYTIRVSENPRISLACVLPQAWNVQKRHSKGSIVLNFICGELKNTLTLFHTMDDKSPYYKRFLIQNKCKRDCKFHHSYQGQGRGFRSCFDAREYR